VTRPRIHPTIRRAGEGDLPDVVRLFAIPNDGNTQDENPSAQLEPCYVDALAQMASDPNNALLVAEVDGGVVGVFQFTVIQHVAFRGGRVAQIENVVVDPKVRGHGIGETMMRWAVDEARRRGCFRLQLTSNKVRKRAVAFYERLGFVVSHEGLKLQL
jgi:ribosomal protein S18 acetylase RimI-like enzyme